MYGCPAIISTWPRSHRPVRWSQGEPGGWSELSAAPQYQLLQQDVEYHQVFLHTNTKDQTHDMRLSGAFHARFSRANETRSMSGMDASRGPTRTSSYQERLRQLTLALTIALMLAPALRFTFSISNKITTQQHSSESLTRLPPDNLASSLRI